MAKKKAKRRKAIKHAHLQSITPQFREFDNIVGQITDRVIITRDLSPQQALALRMLSILRMRSALMEKEINKLLAEGS